jgi:UDP-N-acetyl-D-mannosaminuronate dehydrogenase
MPALLKTVLETASISEVNDGFANMSTLLAVKPVIFIPLWQQPFMRTGNALLSRADRVISATLELIDVVFYCKSRSDECISGMYFTVLQCRSHYICAPGLGINDDLAMQYSPERVVAANQIADALIEQCRLRIAGRSQR